MEAIVHRNDDEGRYELRIDGELVSYADFRERPGAIVVPHVETKPDQRGNGYSTTLMEGVVDDIIARSLKIVPLCPVAHAHVAARPDADQLIAQ
jgi:predicted GNAT family acetyltransferase